MALASPIVRKGTVRAVAQGPAGAVRVQVDLSPTTGTPAAAVTLPLSAAEWNALAELAPAEGGPRGVGAQLTITLA